MIAIVDINTIWRRRPFEALAHQIPVLGFSPRDFRSKLHCSHIETKRSLTDGFREYPIVLPPGWASKFSFLTAWLIWRRALLIANLGDSRLEGLVVTSPHYLSLSRRASKYVPTFYYCSDDYSQYERWGGDVMIEKEAELVRLAKHSFFVSQKLADRAVKNYGVSADRVSVYPNAADDVFLEQVQSIQMDALLDAHPNLQRPIIGVVGGINSRLDFELLNACVSSPAVGSLVMVGAIDPTCSDSELARLQENPKCVFVGHRPHEELPIWMQVLDVALIAYRDTPLNRACSPMRLFDHLASGRSIVANSVCEQICSFSQWVNIGKDSKEVVRLVENECMRVNTRERNSSLLEVAKDHTWSRRADCLAKVITQYL